MKKQGLLRFIRDRLPAASDKTRLETIAKGSDVPYHTLLKIAKGTTADPRISTVENLVRYFERAA